MKIFTGALAAAIITAFVTASPIEERQLLSLCVNTTSISGLVDPDIINNIDLLRRLGLLTVGCSANGQTCNIDPDLNLPGDVPVVGSLLGPLLGLVGTCS